LPKDKVDKAFAREHQRVFSSVDCLSCANCCRSLGPRITLTDIKHISGRLKLKAPDFIQQFLYRDEDGDYVFRSMPCPFLQEDNYCSIYDVRPRACAEYPHTDRRNMHQILNLTLLNSSTCPAVYEIIERLKKSII
jgi:hypothetical protein